MKAIRVMAAFGVAFLAGCPSSHTILEPAKPAVEGEAVEGSEADSKTEQISEANETTSSTSGESTPEAAPESDTKTEQMPEDCAKGETFVSPHTRKDGTAVQGHCRKKPKGGQ